MYVHLLGTAAGGGFPQWNCNCINCHGLRTGKICARARTQSCVAISGDGCHWFLLNVSPDIREQIASFPALQPPLHARRGTAITGILLTDADLDHSLGLLLLREGTPLHVYATSSIRQTLTSGLNLAPTLQAYSGLCWHEPSCSLAPLLCPDGSATGLLYEAFPVSGHPPRFRERALQQPGDRVGYRFTDEQNGKTLLFLPGLSSFEDIPHHYLYDSHALLLDGTFWSEYEMEEQQVGNTSATQMGHLPVGGPFGSLARLATLPIDHKIYMHINNTNPMLLEDSPEYASVRSAQAEVGWDGLELLL
ncbi:pyrroloquinoline quinone biosynthesis protein PqqB [Ktedonosporobacter rubrisoli]|nr:pyrroloquinoline quinone biosynthesis protein PqqB [Ktedonosporobacter rubrisoli]